VTKKSCLTYSTVLHLMFAKAALEGPAGWNAPGGRMRNPAEMKRALLTAQRWATRKMVPTVFIPTAAVKCS